MHTLRILSVALSAGCVLAPASAQSEPAAPRPHIVVFLADDLGWNCVGFNGSEIQTPNIDALAKSGARLDQFYVRPKCVATRAALLTGRYPMRYGMQGGVLRPWADFGLSRDEWLMSDVLGAAGYETAIVGKWHLGHFAPEYLPTARGFEHQYGNYCGWIDYWKHNREGARDWNRDDVPLDEAGFATDLLADECVRLIEQRDPERPLFLYVPFGAPHTPLQAPNREAKMYLRMPNRKDGLYAAMITNMDSAIGRVLDALERAGMRDDTLVLFASDNGAPSDAGSQVHNTPLRGGKGSMFEGGIRVPAVCAWPGRISAGTVVTVPLHIVDLLPTFARLAGASLAETQPLDGVDVWPTIETGVALERREILLNGQRRRSALRAGDWKLVLDKDGARLFNVVEDPSEKENRAAEEPERTAKLEARLRKYLAEAVPALSSASKMPDGMKAPTRWGHPESPRRARK